MARKTLIGGAALEIVDANGSFARFVRESPKVMRQCVYEALDKTAFAVSRRMEVNAPVGPDAPHIRDFVEWKRRGLTAQVGYINATQNAGAGNDATIAEVALFNEYAPNKQPFMRPAAEGEATDFVKRMRAAIGLAERNLSGGGGLL